jgi:Domain of unknown function (DUF4118)
MDGDLTSPDLSSTRPPILLGWLLAVFGPIAVSLALVPVRSDIRPPNVSLLLVLVILGAAVVGGRGPAAVAALVSALSFDLFFTRPYGSFTIAGRDDIETAVLLLLVGLAIGELVVRSQRSRRVAVHSRQEVDRMRRLAELAAGGESTGELVLIVQRELVALLPVDGCRFERPPFRTTLPRLQHGHVHVPSAPAQGTDDGPSHEVELPVWGEGREVGRFVLDLRSGTTGITLPIEARRTAVALADQLGTLLAVSPDDN